MCKHVKTRSRGRCLSLFFSSLLSETRCLTEFETHQFSWNGWPLSQGSTGLCIPPPPALKLQMCTILHGFWECKLKPSCLHRKRLAHLVIPHILYHLLGCFGYCSHHEPYFVDEDTEAERLRHFLQVRGFIECTESGPKAVILFCLPQGSADAPTHWLSDYVNTWSMVRSCSNFYFSPSCFEDTASPGMNILHLF